MFFLQPTLKSPESTINTGILVLLKVHGTYTKGTLNLHERYTKSEFWVEKVHKFGRCQVCHLRVRSVALEGAKCATLVYEITHFFVEKCRFSVG